MTALMRRRMMMEQAKAELPYYPLEDLTWTTSGGGANSNDIPVKNGVVITATNSFQVYNADTRTRLVGYTKSYTVMPETCSAIYLWLFKSAASITTEYLESISMTLEYL